MVLDNDDGKDIMPLNYTGNGARGRKKYVNIGRTKLVVLILIMLVVALTAGILIGIKAISDSGRSEATSQVNDKTSADIMKMIFENMKAENIRANHKALSSKAHMAGTEQDNDLVDLITTRWKEQLDEVKVYSYNAILSTPNSTDPNYVAVKDPDNSIYDVSDIYEPSVTPDEDPIETPPSFNGYGAAGHVEGEMVYVNYGRKEDFQLLKTTLNVSVSGKICIARYGKLFRGRKALEAEVNGCAGLVIFTDPSDYGNHQNITVTYPHNWWLPLSGLQRGTLKLDVGDPLTPYYPAKKYAYRRSENATSLPKIPVTPISAGNALKYLAKMGGVDAPSDWQGLMNLTYKVGGSMGSGYKNHTFVLHSGNKRPRADLKNVVGFIWGSEERDRMVIMGNHRDAWVYGAVDPSSGTTVMLEVARALGEIVKSGKWRPRRTIMFCSWDAEEYGLIGSTEWVEQLEKKLLFRAVTYVNIDIAVQGNATFRAKSTPNLRKLLYDATKSVDNPDPKEIALNRPTVYDTWKFKYYDRDNKSRPYLIPLGSGSDFVPFMQRTGISGMDIRYTYDQMNQTISSYPVYHSLHETLAFYEKFLDPEYKVALSVAQVTAEVLRRLANDVIIPMSPFDYALEIRNMINKISTKYKTDLNKRQIKLDDLQNAAAGLVNASRTFMDCVSKVNPTNVLKIREINDKIMFFERSFLDFYGLPKRTDYRHIVYAPSVINSYQGTGFSGFVDAITAAKENGDWENVKKQLGITTFHLHSAASVLELF